MVLVLLTEASDLRAPLDLGLAFAMQRRSRLALVGLAPRPPLTMCCGPMATPWSPDTVRQDNLDDAVRLCRSAVNRVPADVPVTFMVATSSARALMARMISSGEVASVVLPRRWGRRVRVGRAIRLWREAGIDVQIVGHEDANQGGAAAGEPLRHPAGRGTHPAIATAHDLVLPEPGIGRAIGSRDPRLASR